MLEGRAVLEGRLGPGRLRRRQILLIALAAFASAPARAQLYSIIHMQLGTRSA